MFSKALSMANGLLHLTEGEGGASTNTTNAAPDTRVSNVSSVSFLHDLGMIKGALNDDYLTVTMVPQCQVIDHGFRKATIVCLTSFLSSPLFITLRQKLEGDDFTLNIKTANPVFLKEVRDYLTSFVSRIDEAGSARIYNDLICDAHKIGASDVHFYIPDISKVNAKGVIKVRVWGIMREWKALKLSAKALFEALAAGYGKCSIKGTNSRGGFDMASPSNTITEHKFLDDNGKMTKLTGRFTAFPTVNDGIKVVVRIANDSAETQKPLSFDVLGYTRPQQEQQILPPLQSSKGLVAIFGVTNSGKSTFLYSAQSVLPNRHDIEVYSIEDPTERTMLGVTQISIQRSSDEEEDKVTAKVLSVFRDMMRADPDVGICTEIRDSAMSNLASKFIKSGHLLMTTMHGGGIFLGLQQMISSDFGFKIDDLATKDFVQLLGFQQLLPRLCTDCKVPANDSLSLDQKESLANKFRLPNTNFFKASPQGCKSCEVKGIGSFGIKGQIIAAEFLTPDETMRQLISNKDWLSLERYWRSQRQSGFDSADMRGKTAFEHGLYSATQGLVSLDDIERLFQPLSTYEVQDV
jgi:type II secretory ATPase GspE/PulE/Tfp pilus assembly ATPase PilB-like protein